jgi:hypothetical protein
MPAKSSTKRRGATGPAARKPPRAPEQAVATPPEPRPRVQLRDLLAAESPLWVVLLIVVPIVAIGLELTVGPFLNEPPGVDKDFWWHLATGNWVLDNHRIPTTDPFSWTHGGEDWIAHEWLAGTILALLWRSGGYVAEIGFTAVVAVFGFWRLLAGARYYGISRRLAAVLLLLWGGAFFRIGIIVVRPQVWSWTLLAVLFAELAAYDTGRRRRLWLLPPLFAVWININLTALIGIGCLGAFVLDRLVRRQLDRHLIGVGLLSGLALMVNPHHVRLLKLVFTYLDSGSVRREYVLEWMSPEWSDYHTIPFLLALPLVIPAVWFLVRRTPCFWPGAPLLVLAYQSYQSIRYIPVFILLGFVFAGWLSWKRAKTLGECSVKATPLVPHRPWVLAPAGGACALTLLLALTVAPSQLRREPYPWYFPADATTFYLQNYSGARIFNTYDYGGYLIHRFEGTGNTVYIDGRDEMYGDLQVRRYFYYIEGRPGWQDYFAREGIQVAIIRPVDGLAVQMAQDPRWRLVYADFSLVFVRADLAPRGAS